MRARWIGLVQTAVRRTLTCFAPRPDKQRYAFKYKGAVDRFDANHGLTDTNLLPPEPGRRSVGLVAQPPHLARQRDDVIVHAADVTARDLEEARHQAVVDRVVWFQAVSFQVREDRQGLFGLPRLTPTCKGQGVS
jgi:hypothetical protein